eukprot:6212414-Pleurochrysis_carterae.AAC.7
MGARRSCHRREGRRQQALDNGRSIGNLADASDVRELLGEFGRFAHALDDELEAAVDHGRRQGGGLFRERRRAWSATSLAARRGSARRSRSRAAASKARTRRREPLRALPQ